MTTTYNNKAQATRARRQAAGRYNRPSAAQQAAYGRLVARDGWKNVTVEDARELATTQLLAASQREHFANIVAQADSAVAA